MKEPKVKRVCSFCLAKEERRTRGLAPPAFRQGKGIVYWTRMCTVSWYSATYFYLYVSGMYVHFCVNVCAYAKNKNCLKKIKRNQRSQFYLSPPLFSRLRWREKWNSTDKPKFFFETPAALSLVRYTRSVISYCWQE
jgi:hypothetical protein